jgi:hypothetical protein
MFIFPEKTSTNYALLLLRQIALSVETYHRMTNDKNRNIRIFSFDKVDMLYYVIGVGSAVIKVNTITFAPTMANYKHNPTKHNA